MLSFVTVQPGTPGFNDFAAAPPEKPQVRGRLGPGEIYSGGVFGQLHRLRTGAPRTRGAPVRFPRGKPDPVR